MDNLMRLGLQYFADQETEKSGNDGGIENPTEPMSFDDALKSNKEYQSEFDRRISKAIETAKIKWREEAEEKINEKVSEAQRLAKMTADQKAKYEQEQAEKRLADREAEITKRELKITAIDMLNDKNLPIELVDCLSYTDAESCNKSVKAIETAFQKAVTKAVDDRLRGTVPKTGHSIPIHYTNEQLKTMSVDQINRDWEIIKNNL